VLLVGDPLDLEILLEEVGRDAQSARFIDDQTVRIDLRRTLHVGEARRPELGAILALDDVAELVVDVHEQHDRGALRQMGLPDHDAVATRRHDRFPLRAPELGDLLRRDVHPHVLVDDLDAGLVEQPRPSGRVGLKSDRERQLVESREDDEQRVAPDRRVPNDAEALRRLVLGRRGRFRVRGHRCKKRSGG
jgi:hypothetical protein